jgi:predicted kinase
MEREHLKKPPFTKRVKKLILVAGLPGSGKTTVSRILKKHLNGMHLELDEPKRKIIPKDVMHGCASKGETSPYELLMQVYQHACNALEFIAENTNKKSKAIIIDECFHLYEFRELLELKGKSLGYETYFVNVVCSDEQIVASRLISDEKREKAHVLEGLSLMIRQAFIKVFEPITERECHIVDTVTTRKCEEDIGAFLSQFKLDL